MQRLFDIKKTQLEMVRDRGYDISSEEAILTMTLGDFTYYTSTLAAQLNTAIRSALSRLYLSQNEYNGRRRVMLVYYGSKTKKEQKEVPVHVARNFIAEINKYNVFEAVLIVNSDLSHDGAKLLSTIKTSNIQVFLDVDITYNPTSHIDTPRHELLSPEEAMNKLREMKVDMSKLLLMKTTDPVCRYYGWSAGNIVKIHRNDTAISILAPKSINYRIIVE